MKTEIVKRYVAKNLDLDAYVARGNSGVFATWAMNLRRKISYADW